MGKENGKHMVTFLCDYVPRPILLKDAEDWVNASKIYKSVICQFCYQVFFSILFITPAIHYPQVNGVFSYTKH